MDHFNKDGVEYFQLAIPCPVCIERNQPTQTVKWTHNRCGGDMYVGENAFYLCKKCMHSHPVMETEYSCPNHPNGEFYTLTEGKKWLIPITLTGMFAMNFDSVRFLRKFTASLDDYMDNHNS